MDAINFLTPGNLQLLISLIILISVGAAIAVVYYYFNSRYPYVIFDVYEGNGKLKRTGIRRLYGDKVVPNDLLALILRGNQIPGVPITDFDFYYTPFAGGVKQIYVAKKVGGELIPVRIKMEDNKIEAEKVQYARDLAIKYAHAIEETEKEMREKNKIVEAVASGLPLFLAILIMGAVIYFIATGLTNNMTEALKQIENIVKINKETAELNKELLEILKNNTALNTTKTEVAPITT